jgi:hypothetical protein
MKYDIKAHPTNYHGVTFRSRLEARWAAFFDFIGWSWEYEPIDLNGWTPDFRVHWDCGHSECPNGHTLMIEVKPYYDISEFSGHPCMKYPYGNDYNGHHIPADASAAFGINPDVTYWEMAHGHGGGEETLSGWIHQDISTLWKFAGEKVQYKP